MKYITRFILMGIVAVAGLLSACTSNDEFEPGPQNSGAQVYFPNTVASQYDVSDTESSVTIPVRRVVTDEAMSMPILANDESGIFTIPTSVSFEAGSDLANLVITFDRSALVDGTDYPISLLLNDQENLTDYGNYMLEITITPWPWEELGTGKFRDDWFAPMWQNGGNPEIDVTIHKHKSKEGVYMVEEMFGWPYLTEFFGDTQATIESQLVTYQSTNITIDCSDPTKVLMPRQFTGIIDLDPSYGNYEIAQFQDMYGTLEDGVITFPKEALALVCSAGSMATNLSGLFRIMLPGAEDVDYTLAVAYSGMKVGADNATTSAVMDFTYGADVTGIHYVIAEGDVTATVADIAATIANGTAENIYEIEDFEVGGEKVSVEAALANAGLYTVVALPLDKTGKPTEKNAAAVSFYFPGMGGSEIPECDIKATMGLVSEFMPEETEKYPDSSSLYFQIEGSELKSLKTLLAATSEVEAMLKEGATYELLVDQYGTDRSSDFMPVINQDGVYGGAWISLEESTSYTMIAKASNVYGKTAVVTAEYSTLAAQYPDYEGDLVIGKYLMSYNAPTQDGGSVLLENNMTLYPQSTNATDFFVKNFGLEIGVSWYATYDQTANELTLSGEWKNNEGKNFLGGFVGFGGTEAYMFFSVADLENENADGTDPIVINVDPSTKELKSLKTYIEIYVGTISGNQISSYELVSLYAPGSTIELVSSSMPSMTMLPSVKLDRMLVSRYNISIPYSAQGIMQAQVAKQVAAFQVDKAIRTLDVKVSKCESLPKQINGHAKISKQANNRPLM